MDKREEIVELKADSPIEVDEANPFRNDFLEFEGAVRKIAALLPRLSTPFTVGIYGDWGAGKTSFMRMLSAQLAENKKKNTFWFNAWEYENDTSILLPLLSKLSLEFKDRSAIFESIKKIAASVVITGADIATKISTLNTTSVKDISENIKIYEDEVGERYEKWVSDISELKEQFRKLIKEITKDSDPFYIFIDDLDRCLPENIIKLIENIKHFLSVDGCNCIFIMGLDKAALNAAIRARYGAEIITGDEYLEKIINISFHVPVREYSTSEGYIREKLIAQINEDWRDKVDKEVDIFANILSQTGLTNPRKIKFLISRYLLFMAFNESSKYFMEIIVVLMIYKEFFSDAYKLKKENNRVNFYPRTREGGSVGGIGRSLTYAEIEEASCRGFAIIHTDEKYNPIRYFRGNLGWVIDNCFGKSDPEIQEALVSIYTNPPKGEDLEAVNKLLKSNSSRLHKDYFDAIEFVFSFS